MTLPTQTEKSLVFCWNLDCTVVIDCSFNDFFLPSNVRVFPVQSKFGNATSFKANTNTPISQNMQL